MDEYEAIKKFILRKLLRLRMWGGKHTHIDNLPKGLAKHLYGLAKEVVKELIKKEYLLTKPTHQGTHVSLNPRAIKEIEELAGLNENFDA